MKVLSGKELWDAPSIVQFIYVMSVAKQPLGSQMIEEAMSKHPEYFQDELEHRRKWGSQTLITPVSLRSFIIY